jgi:CBS-domain-containing membrane protein
MNNKWKWVLGLTLAMVVLLVPLFAWRFFVPFGVIGNTNGWYMAMMYGSPAMMSIGMMFLMWLILLASLVLIGLGIAWLVKELSAQNKS